jgi:chaperonin cofactor prefoldin
MIEPDRLVLVHLRELRAELKATEERLTSRLQTMEKRLDAMHLDGVTALPSFIGHRAMTERAMGSIEEELAQLNKRVERLEGAPT